MCLSDALAAREEVLLDVVEDGDPGAACRVSDSLSVRARRTLRDDRTYPRSVLVRDVLQ